MVACIVAGFEHDIGVEGLNSIREQVGTND